MSENATTVWPGIWMCCVSDNCYHLVAKENIFISCNFFHSQRQIKVSTWHFPPRHCSKWLAVFNVLLHMFHDELWGLNERESKNMWELVKSQYLLFIQYIFAWTEKKSSEAGIVNAKLSSGHLPAPFALLSVFRGSSSYVSLLILPQLTFLKANVSLLL